MKMKYFPALFFAAFLPAGFARCQDSQHAIEAAPKATMEAQWISAVKGGVLEFDKGITIGDALDYYKFFSAAPKWTATQSPNKRRIIEVSGTIDFKKLKSEDLGEAAGKIDFSKLTPGNFKEGTSLNLSGLDAEASATENLARLQKINQKFRALQLNYRFQLNVDNSVEVKELTANLTTTDGKTVPMIIPSGERDYTLGYIYDSRLPHELIIEIIVLSRQ